MVGIMISAHSFLWKLTFGISALTSFSSGRRRTDRSHRNITTFFRNGVPSLRRKFSVLTVVELVRVAPHPSITFINKSLKHKTGTFNTDQRYIRR